MFQVLTNDFPFWANFLNVLVISHCVAMAVTIREMKWKSDIKLRNKFPELAAEGLL